MSPVGSTAASVTGRAPGHTPTSVNGPRGPAAGRATGKAISTPSTTNPAATPSRLRQPDRPAIQELADDRTDRSVRPPGISPGLAAAHGGRPVGTSNTGQVRAAVVGCPPGPYGRQSLPYPHGGKKGRGGDGKDGEAAELAYQVAGRSGHCWRTAAAGAITTVRRSGGH